MGTVIIFGVIIIVASILQASTGFGFSIMATPFLLLLFEPKEAIQINLILSLIISCVLITKIKNDIDTGILKRFVMGSAVGLPGGILIFLSANMNMLKLGISIIILMLTLLLMLKLRVDQTKGRDFAVGGISGVLTTSIGMPGPPILLYLSGTDAQKATLRSTTLAFYLFVYFVSLVTQIIFAGTTKTVWISSGFALPLVIVGQYFGQLIFKWMNQNLFRIFTYLILLFTGIYLFIESWRW